MSIRTASYYECVCDGCGAQHPSPGPSREELSAVAYNDGWRFPPEVTRDGSPSKRSSAVCPACLPTFEGKPAHDAWKNRRGKGNDS